MGRERIRRTPHWLVGLGAAALLLSALGAALVWQPFSSRRMTEEAQRRWSARPLDHYLLKIEDQYRLPSRMIRCLQDVEVRGETVVRVVQNTCRRPAQTVSSLFQQIIAQSEPVRCIAFGCACDLAVDLRATYDRQMGYPRSVSISWVTRPNWHHADFWHAGRQLGKMPRCSQTATPIDRTLTVALVPLDDAP
ncbi:MAG: DUF6174 domain-containing protein [Chloroflexota bacterium]|nr:MAG: hypothetical protein DIU80_04530 [Chloroflexota bacterium]